MSADYSKGFGGKFGVQKDRQDRSAAGYDSVEKTELHPSQKDFKKGFGGQYGVDSSKDQVEAHYFSHPTAWLPVSCVSLWEGAHYLENGISLKNELFCRYHSYLNEMFNVVQIYN